MLSRRVFLVLTILFLTICTTYIALASPTRPPGELSITVNISSRTLVLLVNERVWRTYPSAVGKTSTPTPVGEWAIIQKGTDWGGGFGTRWLGLNVPWGIYGIHGTNKPGSIGGAASAGCIRMHNRDVEELYRLVPIGTRVLIIGPFVKKNVHSLQRIGHSGQDVQQVQAALRGQGFDAGFLDGRFGATTAAAVKSLQALYGLTPTGRADHNVLLLLGLRR
ncbi:MAG: putative L,D-transpeptidase YkuD [Firmicutes bacterium]|nr:putative L,D-transpeptidase YkuD [candidate division NPL-UPA2 bacterium]